MENGLTKVSHIHFWMFVYDTNNNIKFAWVSELAKVFGETKNWGRWLEMVAVILPQIISFEMTLLKILSIRVLQLTCMLTRLDDTWHVKVGGK